MRVRLLIRRRRPKKLVARRRRKRSAHTVTIVLLTALVSSLFALLGDGGLVDVVRMRTRAAQLRRGNAALERANNELRGLIEPLRSGDPAAIERLAREKLFMARPGETIYVLPPEPALADPSEPAAAEGESPTAPSRPTRR